MAKNSVTMQEIASRLGVSLKSVSLAINGTGRLSQKTRDEILKTAREMGYRPNFAARSLVTRRSCLIGVLIPFSNASFFSDIISGIEQKAGENGFMLLQGNSRCTTDELHEQIRRFAERNVDGVIVYPYGRVCALVDDLRSLGVPIVQVMNHWPELGSASVTVDNEGAGRCAAEYLLATGHTHIGMITHDQQGGEQLVARRLGFLSAFEKEIPCAESLISIDGGYAAAKKLLAEHPEITAIFAGSDFAALGVLKAALEMGRKIPDELSVIGFDNLDIAAAQLFYPLTTLAQPKEKIGELAGAMMVDLIAEKAAESIVLEAPLIVRSTTVNKEQYKPEKNMENKTK